MARALHGSPLRRPLAGCFIWVALLALLMLALLGHVGLWLGGPTAAALVFAGTALVATIASLPALGFLWWLDRREPESGWLVGAAVLWGAVVSTGLSGIFNSLGSEIIVDRIGMIEAADDAEQIAGILTAALIAPPVEETAKGLALLVLFWFLRAEFDNLRDGLIYGALVGLGFNIAETALYVMKGYQEDGVAPLGVQLAVRFVFLGLNGHLIFSALTGAGLGLARQTPRRWLRLVAPPLGYGLAVLAHALANSFGVLTFAALLAAVGLDSAADLPSLPLDAVWLAAAISDLLVEGWAYLVLALLLILSARWERAVIRLFLADEVGVSVTPTEYASLVQGIPAFGTHEVARRAGRLGRAIFNAQAELAFRLWHLHRDGRDPATDPLVAAWRQDIATLRAQAEPTPPPPPLPPPPPPAPPTQPGPPAPT
jgi:RsiW-degrading membrane proteinase PrsW (M82 family)